jgi:hypothetical protein
MEREIRNAARTRFLRLSFQFGRLDVGRSSQADSQLLERSRIPAGNQLGKFIELVWQSRQRRRPPSQGEFEPKPQAQTEQHRVPH